MQPNEYLILLEQKQITPNWWCSVEYFKKAELNIIVEGNKVFVMDGDLQMFPSISLKLGETFAENPNGFWADFPEYNGQEFLDYEYIYDAKNFQRMEGGNWSVFRKNVKKFPQRIGEGLDYIPLLQGDRLKKLEQLTVNWTDRFDDISDAKVLLEFVFAGENRKALIGQRTGELYGVNIWDSNYLYVNYRYSICANIPFLAEYMRLLFYLNLSGQEKMINDGGIVDNPNLKLFKDKMNPNQIRLVKGLLLQQKFKGDKT